MRRNDGIEWLRACAIISVVQIHCLRPYFIAENAPNFWEEALRTLIDIATPSFFFISGYLTPRQGQGILRRLIRILIPFTVASVIKIGVSAMYLRALKTFWFDLILDLQLRHLDTPDTSCIIHERLESMDLSMRFIGKTKDYFQLSKHSIWQIVSGTSFGHFYFVPALTQLHCILWMLAKIQSETFWSRLIVILILWHLVRTDVFSYLNISDYIAWRLPFLWIFYFLHGFYTRHFIATKRIRYYKKYPIFLASIATLSLSFALLCLTRAIPYANQEEDAHAKLPHMTLFKRIAILYKDIYIASLPAAVCLFADDTSFLGRRSFFRAISLLARYSYSIYLYHGFFLEWLPHRVFIIFVATLALISFLEAICKPFVSTTLFGITPSNQNSCPRDQPSYASVGESSSSVLNALSGYISSNGIIDDVDENHDKLHLPTTTTTSRST